jgi:diguanylate cyclase (GGDEF)-like protein
MDDVAATTTISIGVASYPEDGTTHQELTHAADAALYRAKRAGGNTVSN